MIRGSGSSVVNRRTRSCRGFELAAYGQDRKRRGELAARSGASAPRGVGRWRWRCCAMRRRRRMRKRASADQRRRAHRHGDGRRSASRRTCAPTRSFFDVTVGDPEVADVNPLTDRSLSILGKKIGTTRVSVYGEGKKLVGIFDVEVSYDITRLGRELSAASRRTAPASLGQRPHHAVGRRRRRRHARPGGDHRPAVRRRVINSVSGHARRSR